MAFEVLAPSPLALLVAVLMDAVLGDPRYPFHPIRLMGATLAAFEKALRALHCEGYAGGFLLFLLLAGVWVFAPSAALHQIALWSQSAGFVLHVLFVYSLLALRDLFDHVWSVQRAARNEDLPAARKAAGLLVGRDTERMDIDACRRAAIESLSENFVDGFLSSIFWYALLGVPGLLLFKVASTMDSMVGYKTPNYLRFGWFGARLDDVMNYIPARLAWPLLALSALPVRGASAKKGWVAGFEQHAVLPGPNPGWSEATMAGVLQRRLIGPIWKNGALVTAVWIGFPSDPEGGKDIDVARALRVVGVASLIAVTAACLFRS